MNKKTIGGFIAALRKSSGMTQKELAQMLNVSDKTISHWECDQSAPDLSMIPVIADIFSVSCDELLNGKKYSDEESNHIQIKQNGEVQLNFLLNKNLTNLKMRSLFCIVISAVGVIAGTIFNLEHKNGLTGFLVASAFGVISFVLAIVYYILYMSSLNGIKNNLDVSVAKTFVSKGNAVTAGISYFTVTVLCFGVSLIHWHDLRDIISFGFFYAAIAALVFIAIDIVLKAIGVVYKKVRTAEEKKLFNFRFITLNVAASLLAGGAMFQNYVSTGDGFGTLADILSMACYVYYPLVVILAAIVYAVGYKKLKK